jgi:hypothetical protein
MSEKIVSKAVDGNRDGIDVRELCRWEVRIGLGWLPMTSRHLEWKTQSLR